MTALSIKRAASIRSLLADGPSRFSAQFCKSKNACSDSTVFLLQLIVHSYWQMKISFPFLEKNVSLLIIRVEGSEHADAHVVLTLYSDY
jgi:hypothetical protein